jgi:glutamine phosphoribosylpyrophosphate amidotransferase
MCGIAGILYPESDLHGKSPVGDALATMTQCLQHRGADSAGVAVFTSPAPQASITVVLPQGQVLPEPQFIMEITGGVLTSLRPTESGFAAAVSSADSCPFGISALIGKLEDKLPGAVVTSFGNSMSVYKTVGLIERLYPTISPLIGTHGIAHLRLATESKIDPAHAQPFWGRPFPDVAVTHNGHITNYYKLRKQLEARDLTFASRNDSEIIGILIGEKISEGRSLTSAIAEVVPSLDGSFSFIVATSTGLGVARDRFATKPLLFFETDKMLAIASEQQALRRLGGEHIKIQEIQPKEFRTWERV